MEADGGGPPRFFRVTKSQVSRSSGRAAFATGVGIEDDAAVSREKVEDGGRGRSAASSRCSSILPFFPLAIVSACRLHRTVSWEMNRRTNAILMDICEKKVRFVLVCSNQTSRSKKAMRAALESCKWLWMRRRKQSIHAIEMEDSAEEFRRK